MNQSRVLILLLLLFLGIASCKNDNTKTEAKNTITSEKKNEEPFIEEEAEIEIINQTLELLTPKTVMLPPPPLQAITFEKARRNDSIRSLQQKKRVDSLGLRLFVSDKLTRIDQSLIDLILEHGADSLFMQLASDSLQPRSFDTKRLINYGNVDLHAERPQTKDESYVSLGWVSYSRILFSEDQKKAIFIYQCTSEHSFWLPHVKAVVVKREGTKWEIVQKIELQ